jgi:hypothetical protein
MLVHGFQQIQASEKIRLVVQLGSLDRFGDESFSSEMQHAFDHVFAENAFEICGIAEIAFECRSVFQEGPVPRGEVIENERLKAGCFQSLNSVASDVTGAPGDQDHLAILLKYSIVS